MARDFYAILALPKTATEDQIRQRFRQLARERHPDRFLGEQKRAAEAAFQDITQAFNVLADPERRRQHDNDMVRPKEAPADPKQVARAYLQRGVRAYHERNLLEAADNFDRATVSDPSNAQAWYNLAVTCSQNPVWVPRAVAAIERACELETMNGGYWKHAGRILALAGRPERALEHYRKALEWGENDETVQQAIDELSKPGKRSGIFGKAG